MLCDNSSSVRLSVFVYCMCVSVKCDCQPLCFWVCVKICARVACACLSIYWYFAFQTSFFYFIVSRYWSLVPVWKPVHICVCASLRAFECVYEAELIFLHESKQQVALTFSKQQACSYFDIDSRCTFTVKCGWIGVGACWIRSIHWTSRGHDSLLLVLWRNTVERWGIERQYHREEKGGRRRYRKIRVVKREISTVNSLKCKCFCTSHHLLPSGQHTHLYLSQFRAPN